MLNKSMQLCANTEIDFEILMATTRHKEIIMQL